MATWNPHYDFAVPEDEYARTLKQDRGLREDNGVAWVEAPDSSHCEAFRYFDNRTAQFSLLDPSELQVRFKAKGRQPAKEYLYFFADAAEGADVFEALCRAASPWAEVGIPRLVNAAVPYFRRS